MNDITERLRDRSTCWCAQETPFVQRGCDSCEERREAAEEIERLRTLVTEWVQADDHLRDVQSLVDARDLYARQARVADALSAFCKEMNR